MKSLMGDGGNAMEEFSILITQLDPSHFTTLSPINSLGFKKF